MSKLDRPRRRMLLVASVGVATVSYIASACETHPVAGNLAQPMDVHTVDAGSQPLAIAVDDAGAAPAPTASIDISPTSGNLMMPTPQPSASASGTAKPHPPKPPPLRPHPTGGNLMAPRPPEDRDPK